MMKARVGIVVAWLVASVAFGEVVIDDFSEGNRTITSRGQTAWYDTGLNVLGGVRDGSAGCENSPAGGLTTAKIQDGLFKVYSNKSGAPSIYLSYDQTAGWGGTPLDDYPFNGSLNPVQDLTENGSNDRFRITFASANGADPEINFFNDVHLVVKVEGTNYLANMSSSANTWMEANYDDLNATTPVAASFEVSFSEFGDIDMSQAQGFFLHVCSENMDMEYAIDKIAAVPEPASVLMIGFGAGLIFLVRRFYNRA